MQEQEQAPDVATRFRLAIVEEARDAIESAWSVLEGAARRLAEAPAATRVWEANPLGKYRTKHRATQVFKTGGGLEESPRPVRFWYTPVH